VGQATPFNPVFGGDYPNWTEPFDNQFLGEVHNYDADNPGSNTDGWTTASQIQYQTVNGSDSPPWSGVDTAGLDGPIVEGLTNPRATVDGLVYHGGSVGNSFDMYCDVSTCN
jgi:hypothetical protein